MRYNSLTVLFIKNHLNNHTFERQYSTSEKKNISSIMRMDLHNSLDTFQKQQQRNRSIRGARMPQTDTQTSKL